MVKPGIKGLLVEGIRHQYSNLKESVESGGYFKNENSLKNQLRNVCMVFVLSFMGNYLYGQNGNHFFGGTGAGLDYGGIIGAKIEYLLVKSFGAYGGVGYILLSTGWNGTKGNKFSVGLFVPIRSQKFKDNYDEIENDPNIDIKNGLLPIAFSIGYNIAF